MPWLRFVLPCHSTSRSRLRRQRVTCLGRFKRSLLESTSTQISLSWLRFTRSTRACMTFRVKLLPTRSATVKICIQPSCDRPTMQLSSCGRFWPLRHSARCPWRNMSSRSKRSKKMERQERFQSKRMERCQSLPLVQWRQKPPRETIAQSAIGNRGTGSGEPYRCCWLQLCRACACTRRSAMSGFLRTHWVPSTRVLSIAPRIRLSTLRPSLHSLTRSKRAVGSHLVVDSRPAYRQHWHYFDLSHLAIFDWMTKMVHTL
mmetsp:Transcript_59682/g.106450  ORF Transcript_59682/g.106450 Transcript_59682/m.106450 type:complete len:259 (+) Transcript_59682:1870-2646(+)